MSDSGQIRVILRWIQIKDNKEAMWDDEGEFRFRSKVTTDGQSHELTFPEQGYWSISDHPRRNKVDKIDKVLYEGGFGDNLIVELFGNRTEGRRHLSHARWAPRRPEVDDRRLAGEGRDRRQRSIEQSELEVGSVRCIRRGVGPGCGRRIGRCRFSTCFATGTRGSDDYEYCEQHHELAASHHRAGRHRHLLGGSST